MAGRIEVLVLGSGVIGMTTALCLAEAGLAVRVLTDRPHRRTTSAIAGALWGPYVVEDPRVVEWSLGSLDELRRISSSPGSGVAFVAGHEASRVIMRPPAWLRSFQDFALDEASVPAGYVMGWSYSAPIFDMPTYLDHLEQRLHAKDVRIDVAEAPLRSLNEVTGEAPVVVNCTGLGARDLVPDPLLTSSWGQLVVVENPGVTGFFSDYPELAEPTYYIAHRDHVVLGGCIVEHELDPASARAAAERIVQRCSAIEPRLSAGRVLGLRTGLRPVRPEVRLEQESIGGATVVHNYGHGGAGVTMSWGCAQSVRALLT